jgi:hypothetical protein
MIQPALALPQQLPRDLFHADEQSQMPIRRAGSFLPGGSWRRPD